MKNMTKRPICFLLVAVMLLTLIPAGIIGVSAEETSSLVWDSASNYFNTNYMKGARGATAEKKGDYISYTGTNATPEQLNIIQPSNFVGGDYPILAIRYRYDKEYTNAGLSIGYFGSGKALRTKDGAISTYADGNWHNRIINLSTIDKDNASYDWSTATTNYFFVFPFGWNSCEGSQFDIAYIGLFKSVEDAQEYVGESALAGGELKAAMDGTTTHTVTAVFEDNCVKATGVETVQDAEQIKFKMPEAVDGGKYPFMAIKYKYDKAYDNAKLSLFRTNFEAVNKDGATGTVSNRSADGQIATFSDGEWQIAILDMRTVNFESNRNFPAIGGKTWADYTYNTFTFLPFGWNAVKDSVFSLEYFGFFSTKEKAVSYVKNMEQVPSVTVSEGVKSIAQYHDNGTFANKINVTWADSTFDRVVLKNAKGDILSYSTDANKTATFDVEADGEYSVVGENTSKTYIRGWQPGTDGTSIRFVASLDDLTCTGAGMEITAVSGDVTKNFGMDASGITKTVYGSIKGGEINYTAADLATSYIHVAVVDGLPTDAEITFTVKPFKVVDGERVYGEEMTVVYSATAEN